MSDDGTRQDARDERTTARAFLDLEAGTGPVQVLDATSARAALRSARRIAIIGASSRPWRASNDVMRYLLSRGYDCVPINPGETEVLGRQAYPDLASAVGATGAFDLVDVFRRPELCPTHAEEAVAVGARCLWLQLGIVSWEAARIAHEGGLSVVMDRCTKIEDAASRR